MLTVDDLYKLADVSGVKFQTLAEDSELFSLMTKGIGFDKLVEWVKSRY
jgi:hypothetical protein